MIEALRLVFDELERIHAKALDTAAGLSALTAAAEGHRQTIEEAASAAQQAAASLRTDLETVDQQVLQVHAGLYALKGASTDTASHVSDAMGRVGTVVTEGSATVRGMSTTIIADAQSLAQQTGSVLDGLRSDADQTHQHLATRLDDLADAVSDHSNLWNKAVAELIDAVQQGVEPVEKLLRLYGDAQIGGQRLREYLAGMDLHVYHDQVADLINALQRGKIEIGDVLEYLNKSQLPFVKQLANTIELFRQGKVSLERVKEIVAQLQKLWPDSQFSDLAQALQVALQQGR
jgi:hypothetical protein